MTLESVPDVLRCFERILLNCTDIGELCSKSMAGFKVKY